MPDLMPDLISSSFAVGFGAVVVQPITPGSPFRILDFARAEARAEAFYLMILPQSNSNEFLHLYINDNDVSGTLQGNTNWLNQFLFPFEDNKKPNIKYISNNSIISNDIDINAIEFRGNGCAYNINPQPEIRNLSYSDLNGNSRRIIFDKLDLIIRTTDPHIQADGSGSTGNNGIDRIKYQLINSSTQIALEDQNINFSDVPNNSIANQIFDYRSSQSAHTYIISNNNINVPYDRFLNTRLTIDGNETYDLLNRNGLDAISNNHTKFSEGYYEVKVIVSDRNDFTNSDPNESIVSVPILIDNFLPYIKKVTLNDSEGVFYEAEWTLNGSETALEFEQCTYRTNITTGFNVQIETSETLDNLSMSLAGVTNNLVSTNTEKTVWELQNPFNGNASANQTITFTGSDTAGNPLLTDPTNLYWRTGDNIWQNGTTSQPITGNSSITGTDIIHKINMKSLILKIIFLKKPWN